MQVDLQAIANKVVKDCLRVKPGERFWISCADDYYFNFCEEVAIEAIKLGAYPFISSTSDRIYREVYRQSEEYLKAPAIYSEALVDVVDVKLMVAFPRDPNVGKGATPAKLAAASGAGRPVQEKIYKRNADKVRFRQASFLYPTREMAAQFGIPYEEFADMVWGSLNIDYDKLRERARKISAIMEGADQVNITNPQGSDITFSIKGRPSFIDDGSFDDDVLAKGVSMMNLPTGEVCIAPLETSAKGVAVFEYNRFQGHELRNIKMEFKNGRISNLEGDEGADYYRKVLEEQTGDKDQIAELGIGLNPRIDRVVGELALDEKIIGTIHIATGENRMMFGQGKSSFHWDLVMMKPTVSIDGKVIMEHGEYCV